MKKLQVKKSTEILAKQNYLLIFQAGATGCIGSRPAASNTKEKKCKRENFPAKYKIYRFEVTGLKLQV
ncbi:hypothetical protein MSSAC_1190 [Methanosarcina siciliae C2J]|uniref:Uncharacterized protein n=1 Tax=Methanosarcina siciliae C2J TaxID=1434118 RepID=A0A0E3PL22_9EURY|nr:hypothetical protein [Methanosarcina siciliae]AKB35780.1 hypothetical protein MSSAC_1190 [Methanosarcina siciliae C2J]